MTRQTPLSESLEVETIASRARQMLDEELDDTKDMNRRILEAQVL